MPEFELREAQATLQGAVALLEKGDTVLAQLALSAANKILQTLVL